MGWLGLTLQEKVYWSKFKVNDRVDLVIDMDMKETYATTIDGISAEYVTLKPPRVGNSVVEIMPKVMVLIRVYTENGIFKFRSRIASQDWKTDYSIVIRRPQSIEHFQQRQFYRMPIILPVEYGVISNYDISEDAQQRTVTTLMGVTKNISEGGALIVVDRPFAMGTVLKVHIKLDDGTSIEAAGKILEQKALSAQDKIVTRLQFVSINEEDRDTIRRFVITSAPSVQRNKI